MALDLTADQKELGQSNFRSATEGLALTRRDLMKTVAAGAGVVPVAAAVYYGYESIKGKPVKAALIGCGDEGGVLLGEHNPDYMEFVASCDIRPFNKKRIIDGDSKVPLRKGFRKVYGDKYANDMRDKHFYTDYREMLEKEKDIEAVVIALPLHLHAPVAIECMEKYKKHVLCEKLMARNIGECKKMIEVAQRERRVLSVGHQRHYSLLYSNSDELIRSGVLGDVKHIRALWHRNFSWNWQADPNDPKVQEGIIQPQIRDGWTPPIFEMDYQELKDKLGKIEDHRYGYKDIYELIRWRLFERTGGGLMAELGSHQLDAASIFLGKAHPLSVTGVGTKSFFRPGKNPRDIDDHVFVTFEFPGPNHPNHPSKKGNDKYDIVVVTYSSISTNGFEQYGECVMGTRGTLIVEGEQKAMLFREPQPGVKAAPRETTVKIETTPAGKAAMESGPTWGGPAAAASPTATVGGAGAAPPVSRGYREEMEDFAYCIRRWDEDKFYYEAKDENGKYKAKLPRCHGEVAMADAIIALTSNIAMAPETRQRIEFDERWFSADPKDAAATPEADVPKVRKG